MHIWLHKLSIKENKSIYNQFEYLMEKLAMNLKEKFCISAPMFLKVKSETDKQYQVYSK